MPLITNLVDENEALRELNKSQQGKIARLQLWLIGAGVAVLFSTTMAGVGWLLWWSTPVCR